MVFYLWEPILTHKVSCQTESIIASTSCQWLKWNTTNLCPINQCFTNSHNISTDLFPKKKLYHKPCQNANQNIACFLTVTALMLMVDPCQCIDYHASLCWQHGTPFLRGNRTMLELLQRKKFKKPYINNCRAQQQKGQILTNQKTWHWGGKLHPCHLWFNWLQMQQIQILQNMSFLVL